MTQLRKIAVLIPALDEAPTISGVVQAAMTTHEVTRVVVIDNGSTDATARIASLAGAEIIFCPSRGKGEALLAGLAALGNEYDVVVTLDADLKGLQPRHISRLITALENGFVMSCGVLESPGWRRALYWGPLGGFIATLSGQRAIRLALLRKLSHKACLGYNFESELNKCCDPKRVTRVRLENVIHVSRRRKPSRSGISDHWIVVWPVYARLFFRSVIRRRPRDVSRAAQMDPT